MTDRIKLQRLDPTPWGFRLTGGLDFGTPITVVKVTGGSIAAEAGIQVGDIVVDINGKSTKQLTHTEAQNWIKRCGNLIYFNVIRGSVITPPSTPYRGTTPVPGEVHEVYDVNDNYCNYISGGYSDGSLSMEDGLTEREYTLLNGGDVPRPFVGIKVPSDLTDLELDELLTGNEEVLDQGILGINFKKFFPQVDFIRHSEVFKVLQDENTHKEVPEQVQLKINPEKRFSTFLQKPKGPPAPKKVGPYWHYPKAPNYLPRKPKPSPEQPRRRKEETHSVLWLFLRKEGDKVIDERWGTPDEERKNVSRNTNRDDEGVIMPPLSHRNTPIPYLDPLSDRIPESRDELKDDIQCVLADITNNHKIKNCLAAADVLKDTESRTESRSSENVDLPTTKDDHESQETGPTDSHRDTSPTPLTPSEKDSHETELPTEVHVKAPPSKKPPKVFISQILTEVDNCDERGETIRFEDVMNDTSGREENLESQKAFVNRLAEIQQQILALEGQAPRDLTSQLVDVQQQLNRILQLNKLSIQEDEITSKEEIAEQESYLQADFEHSSSISATSDSEYVVNYTINPYRKKQEAFDEYTVQIDNIDETPSLTVKENGDENFEKFEVGEFEICDTSENNVEEETMPAPEPTPRKKPFHPITPAARPIVLPGGRQWRTPKDAAHNDFYQGILVEEAEVLIGNNKSINFKKYVPPKFDTDASPVCKLIREMEIKTDASERQPEAEYYHTPLTKRHFYNATLSQPPPVGVVELKDLF